MVTGEVHLRCLAPAQLSYEETSQRWRALGDNVSGLTGPGIEPINSSAGHGECLQHNATRMLSSEHYNETQQCGQGECKARLR